MFKKHLGRRRFLRGLGGVAVGLPALDIFMAKPAKGAAPTRKIYSAFLIEQNGCIQGQGDTPLYWPSTMGAINPTAMAGVDAGQTTSVLKDYASKLNFVRNTSFRYSNNHGGGPVAALCACPTTGSGSKIFPTRESADVYIAAQLTPGTEPLNVYAGRKSTYRDDAFSWAKNGVLRIGDNNPSNVYSRLMGASGMLPTQADPGLLMRLTQRRKSVNDLIRAELQDFLARKDLSMLDRQRLDLHLSNIRDMEGNIAGVMGMTPAGGGGSGTGAGVDPAALAAINGMHTTDANFEKVVNLQIDLIAFAFASDRHRTATLQIGGCNDHTRYMINGVLAPPFHFISHKIQSDGDNGAAITNAEELHHQIDIIHAKYFKHLCDVFSAYSMPEGGNLLDASVNVLTNSVSNGPPHSGRNIPYVLAGSAGGFLKTGNHFLASGTNQKVLNTIISAVGCRKANGDLVDDFGDPAPAATDPKLLTQIIA